MTNTTEIAAAVLAILGRNARTGVAAAALSDDEAHAMDRLMADGMAKPRAASAGACQFVITAAGKRRLAGR